MAIKSSSSSPPLRNLLLLQQQTQPIILNSSLAKGHKRLSTPTDSQSHYHLRTSCSSTVISEWWQTGSDKVSVIHMFRDVWNQPHSAVALSMPVLSYMCWPRPLLIHIQPLCSSCLMTSSSWHLWLKSIKTSSDSSELALTAERWTHTYICSTDYWISLVFTKPRRLCRNWRESLVSSKGFEGGFLTFLEAVRNIVLLFFLIFKGYQSTRLSCVTQTCLILLCLERSQLQWWTV